MSPRPSSLVCALGPILVACGCSTDPPPAAPPIDAGARDGALPGDDIDDFDAGGPDDCEGVWVGRVSGQVLDFSGAPPTAPAIYTICGNACVVREIEADGSFDHRIDFCYGEGEGPLPRPVFIFHGLDRYADLFFDFIPPDARRVDEHHFARTFYVPRLDMASRLRIDATAAQTLSDGAGFELSYEAGAITPPFGREEIAVIRVPADRLPPHAGIESLLALYALLPDETGFGSAASVRFPNHAGLAPGTPIEIVAIGNTLTGDPYAGNLGTVATGEVTADGAAVVTGPGQGVRALSWLGYRAAAR